MRLPKIALVAACALTAIQARAQVRPVTLLGAAEVYTTDTTIFNPAGGGTIAISAGATLTIFSDYATTVEADLIENGETAQADLIPLDGTVFKVDPITRLATGGNVVKQGGGILQLNSWTAISGTQRQGTDWWMDADGDIGYDYPFSAASHFAGTASARDLMPSVVGNPDARNGSRLNGLQGTFTIDQGTVRLAGFLNVWHDHGYDDVTATNEATRLPVVPRYTIENADLSDALSPRMTGVSGIILNGSSVLELTNSPLNVATGTSNDISQGNALRVQYLRNLQAGLNAVTGLEHDQLQAELIVGTTPEYRVVLHVDQGKVGSIGILAGAGGVLKSGPGEFRVINESRLTGDITIGGGRLVLDSAQGLAIASAASVNLAGLPDPSDLTGEATTNPLTSGSRRGAHVRYLEQNLDVTGDNVPEVLYKPAYAPAPGTRTLASSSTTDPVTGVVTTTWTPTVTGASLEILGDQTIRNFQSNFAMAAAPDTSGTAASAIQRAADSTNRGELVIAGTGRGSEVILNGHTLTILQDKARDGFYEGKILSGFDYNLTLTDETGGSYLLAFDRLPDFGTFQLRVTPTGGLAAFTPATDISSAAEIRSNLASLLGVAESAVTVTDVSALTGDALAWRVQVGAAGTVEALPATLRAGRVVLAGTDADAKLALNLESATFGEIDAQSGSLIVNAVGLGNSRINISTGELRIIQFDASSLEATVLGSGTLRVVASASVDNGSGTPIEVNSLGNIGTLNFAQQQRGFTGELVANDGVDISLSAVGAGVVDTLVNARAITLDGGTSGRGSTLRFNDTRQLVRNLSGDAASRIELGRGTMTLAQTDASRTFLGTMTGVGSVLKEGGANFAFRGVDNLGVAGTDFTGALAVRQGSVSLATADTLRNVSGVVLLQGASLSAAGTSQTLGSLFGESGSTVDLGAATLSIGFTPGQLAAFRQQLETSFGLQLTLAHNYLATTANAYQLLRFTDPLTATERLLVPSDLDRIPLDITVGEELSFLAGAPGFGLPDQTRIYLERVAYLFDRDGDGTVSAAETATAAASAATLGYAGQIIATGANQSITFDGSTTVAKVALSKTGWETLRLLGASNQLGGSAVVVRQGVLEALPAALATAGSVVVLANSATIDLDGDGDADADPVLGGVDVNNDGAFDDADRVVDGTIALLVESGTVDWSIPILGDGNLRKTGAGTLRLAPAAALHTGLTDIQGGTLEMTLVPDLDTVDPLDATLGAVAIGADATLALRTDSATSGAGTDFTYVAPGGITGAGTLAKLGQGALTIDGALVAVTGGTRPDPLATLSLDVREGALRFTDELPGAGVVGRVAIASGASLGFDLDAGDIATLQAEFSGSGTLRRTGAGTLALATDPAFAPAATLGSLGFTGTLELSGGDTSVERAGAFAAARVSVLGAGTTLTLRAGAYQFAGLTGAAGTIFALDPLTELTLEVASPRTDAFLGRFTGGGDLIKAGTGVLSLEPGAANALDAVTVRAGTLRATVDGLGSAATLTVDAGAFLEFNVASGTQDYTVAIGGAGSVSKLGAGTLRLLGSNLVASGDLRVLEGTLVVDDRRVGAAVPAAAVSDGATLEILLTADRTLASQVTGDGNLVFDADGTARTVTLLNAPAHGGLIGLKGLASLVFDGAVGDVTLGGLAAAAGSTVTLNAGQTLALDQSSDGAFLGDFAGAGNLVIQGPGVFAYESNSGDLSTFGGTVTVDGGKLQVGVANTKAIALEAGSTLLIDVASGTAAYAGSLEVLSGTASLIKVGAGTLDLTAGIPRDPLSPGGIDTLTVTEGKVLAGVVGGAILDGADIILATGGSLAVAVGAPDTVAITELITSVGTGGAFEKTGAGKLVLDKGTATADIAVSDGTLQLGLAGAPAAAGRDITVALGATLTGSGTVARNLTSAGTLAPGYSPGLVTVAGDFVNSGTLVMELAADDNDRVRFAGTASLNAGGTGRLELARFGAGNLFGRRHVLFADTAAPGAGSFIGAAPRFNEVVSTGASPLRVLVAYPTQLLAGFDGILGNADDATDPLRALAIAGEVAVYVARAEADYAALTPTSPYLATIQQVTKVDVDPVTGVSTLGTGFSALGARLAVLTDSSLVAAVDNLRPRGQAALLSGAAAGFRAQADVLQRRLEQRRFDGADMSVKERDWFVDATQGQLDLDNGHEARNSGATAGLIRPMGVDGYWAVTLGVETLRSEAGPSSYKGSGFRLGGALGVMNVDRTLALDVGLSLGRVTGDLSRTSLLGGSNLTDPAATSVGLWVRGSAAVAVGSVAVTPFLSLETSKTTVDRTVETGASDPLGDSLSVREADHTQTAARAGLGLHHSWVSAGGDWRYRLGLEVAYAMQVDGEDATLVSNHAQLGGGDVSSTFNILPGDGFSVAPTLTFGPSADSTFTLGLRLEQGSEGEATSLQLGYRRKF